MRVQAIYNPTGRHLMFYVHFNSDGKQHQHEAAVKTIEYYEALTYKKLVHESQLFYKWLIMYHISPVLEYYAFLLLSYFHEQGLLKCKEEVNVCTKQQKKRYLVMFEVGSGQNKQVFTQTYNSIRELRADTGKKPSQINMKLAEDSCIQIAKK